MKTELRKLVLEYYNKWEIKDGNPLRKDIIDEHEIVVIDKASIINLINDGYEIKPEEKNNSVLLHGRIGASILKSKFKLEDEDILQAVRWHTTGHPDMGNMGQVLFIADYIEQGRKHITQSVRETLMQLDLNEMTLKVLNDQTAYLRDKG